MKGIFRKPSLGLFQRKKKVSDAGNELPSDLEELPLEVKRDIASFLPVHDLLRLSETSTRMNRDLSIVTVSSPLTDRASQNKSFDTDYTSQCFAVVVPNQEEPHSHSTTFSFDIATDQVKDGRIWIMEHDLPAIQSIGRLKDVGVGSGNFVAKTRAAAPKNRHVQLSFYPKAGKFYQFWVKAGYSQLRVNNMMLHSVGLGVKPSSHSSYQFEVRVQRIQRFAVR